MGAWETIAEWMKEWRKTHEQLTQHPYVHPTLLSTSLTHTVHNPRPDCQPFQRINPTLFIPAWSPFLIKVCGHSGPYGPSLQWTPQCLSIPLAYITWMHSYFPFYICVTLANLLDTKNTNLTPRLKGEGARYGHWGMVSNMRKEVTTVEVNRKHKRITTPIHLQGYCLVSKSSLLPETRLLETRSQSSLCVLSFRQHLVNVC